MSVAIKAWRCVPCGYIHRGEAPPDLCPVCGAGRDDFEPVGTDKAAAAASSGVRWECRKCGYIHTGDTPPDLCPVCGAGPDQFDRLANVPAATGAPGVKDRVVIVGGGIAGIAAAESMRKAGMAGPVTIISSEEEPPYYRINLTRFLAGEVTLDALVLHPAPWYHDQRINLMRGETARSIDLAAREVHLLSGDTVPFDRLILTPGAHAFVPPLAGADREGVLGVRTLAQSRRIANDLHPGLVVVVIGGGLLGLETAAALAAHGAAVTVVEVFEWLLPRQLDRPAAAVLERHVRGLGIDLVLGGQVQELPGDERVTGVTLKDGRTIPADLVIVCIGVRPNIDLARRAGLKVNKGIVVDDHLRTSHPAVFAAGDAIEHRGVVTGTWSPAFFQGRIAGLNAAGQATEYGGLAPSYAIKVLGISMLSMGTIEPPDPACTVLTRAETGLYQKLIFQGPRLVGAILLGDAAAGPAVKKAIENHIDLSAILASKPDAREILKALAQPR
ncbi:MAG: FAD-dependent oxidoreductase [Planctomycetota bacterium]